MAFAFATSGCAQLSQVESPSESPVLLVALSTINRASNGCPAALLGEVTLRGDPTDQVLPVWVEHEPGVKYTILWPFGYGARFAQIDQIHDFYACTIVNRTNPRAS